MATPVTHTVVTQDFEGPLALLLELVERQQLEVTDISIATITTDYLAHIRKLTGTDPDPDNLSEFLQLGARLVYIKSLALLPREPTTEQAEELRQLQLELAAYRQYQQAARELVQRSTGSSWPRPVVSRLAPHQQALPDISLEQLAAAFNRALRQVEPARPSGLIRQTVSQAAIAQRLRRHLRRGPVELQQIIDEARNRLEVVVTFLTVLEFIKQDELRVTQDGQFAPVIMEPTHA